MHTYFFALAALSRLVSDSSVLLFHADEQKRKRTERSFVPGIYEDCSRTFCWTQTQRKVCISSMEYIRTFNVLNTNAKKENSLLIVGMRSDSVDRWTCWLHKAICLYNSRKTARNGTVRYSMLITVASAFCYLSVQTFTLCNGRAMETERKLSFDAYCIPK